MVLIFHGQIKISPKRNLCLTHFSIQNVHTVASAEDATHSCQRLPTCWLHVRG